MHSKEVTQKTDIQDRKSIREILSDDSDRVGRRLASWSSVFWGFEIILNRPDVYKPLETLPVIALLGSVVTALAFQINIIEHAKSEEEAPGKSFNKPEIIVFQGREHKLLVAREIREKQQILSEHALQNLISEGQLDILVKNRRVR